MSSMPPIRVAQYVRMSTDHQRYSTENQAGANLAYASIHGMEIVRTYEDAGISGLQIKGRIGLQTLLRDVESGKADFDAILVYDVSRWGRFRNADEAASYEFRCTQGGVRVVYVAEAFTNDGSMQASVFKAVMRVMSYSYSKDLSDKVFAGHCKLLSLGYHQGGRAGFAMQRQVVGDARQIKGILGPGERKGLQDDNVVLIPGLQHEVDLVVRVFRLFTEQLLPERLIAHQLNTDGFRTDTGKEWSQRGIRFMLTNERYIGLNVYNRHTYRLGEKDEENSPSQWLRSATGEELIVPLALWERAQALYLERSRLFDDTEMLSLLGALYAREGTLSGILINEQADMPTSYAYARRFGGLLRAYSLIGFEVRTDKRYITENKVLRERHPQMLADLVAGLDAVKAEAAVNPTTSLMTVNGQFTVALTLARCSTAESVDRWHLKFDESLRPDIAICVRMNRDNTGVLDYYVFSRLDLEVLKRRLSGRNEFSIDAFRFDDLSMFYEMAARAPLRLVA